MLGHRRNWHASRSIQRTGRHDEMTKGSGLNGSKRYRSSISSYFPPESGFHLLSSPNVWTVPHFQTICYLSLCHDFALHFGERQRHIKFSLRKFNIPGKLVMYLDRNLTCTGLLLFAGKVDPTPHTSSFNMGYLVSPYPYPNGTAGPIPVSMVSTIRCMLPRALHWSACEIQYDCGLDPNSSCKVPFSLIL
jgi:hypothetical protein